MPDLKKTRNRLRIAIAALGLVDVAAVAMLMTPLAGSEQSRQQELRQLWLNLKAREAAPWRGLDKKIPLAEGQINDFYHDRLPAGYAAISTDVDRLASESGVRMSAEKYEEKEAGMEGLDRIEIEADLSGDYLQLVRFINALERNHLFFMVDNLELGSEQNGIVKLRIKLETYLRTKQ
jgi:type II secretion system (T2SS) protein M